jgi:glutathione S-transferase
VDRVALVMAHKGLGVESVWIDPADRSPVGELSGQDLVPVIEDGGEVVADSTRIVEYLDERYPQPAVYPADTAPRAEVEVFIDWFDTVWKAPPNLIAGALDAGTADPDEIARHSAAMQGWLGLFERLLEGREHLFGEFSAADCAAWPFVRYAVGRDPEDDETFHRVLEEHQRLGPEHGRVRAWIERMGERPRI